MKVIFNTKNPKAPASEFYSTAFGKSDYIVMYDWKNYHLYDIALFMTYKQDLKDLVFAKKTTPNIITGLIDPRGSFVERYEKYIDFFIVDSIEMQDFFAGYRKPIFTYTEFPDLPLLKRKHRAKKNIIIGYHGNKVHLEGMFPNITNALEQLGRKYDIELWAVYDKKSLGIARAGVPNGVQVRHIQWDESVYQRQLAQVDIGIVPALMPIRKLSKLKKKSIVFKPFFNDNDDDYLIKFKMPSNPGRIIVFGLLGIPVVADIFPSACHFIKNESSGLLAYSCGGWYMALEKLIKSAKLRQTFADEMQSFIRKDHIFEVQNEKLRAFFNSIEKGATGHKKKINEPSLHIDRNKKFWMSIVGNYFNNIRRRLLKRV